MGKTCRAILTGDRQEEDELQAIRLRRQRRMSLGDAVVAGTALAHGLTLLTRNLREFQWIEGLTAIDPLSTAS